MTEDERLLPAPGCVLHEATVSTREPPVNLDEEHRELFEHELRRVIPATRLLRFDRVDVTPDGLLSRLGRILPEAFSAPEGAHPWQTPRAKLKLLVKSWLRHRRRLIDEAFWVTDDQSGEFFHWMTDALPRLAAIHEHLGQVPLLLPGALRDRTYVTASLEALPVPQVRFVDEPCRCRKLWLPTMTAPSGNYNRDLIRSVRDHLVRRFGAPGRHSRRERLYVSRAAASRRRVKNEAEVVSSLESRGFRTVRFERNSFADQVAVASRTRYLVSNHGAGLTNMLFMPEGSAVLELRKKDDAHNNCYFALASALGLKYYYQVCEAVDPDEHAHTADLIVDIEKLARNVALMMG